MTPEQLATLEAAILAETNAEFVEARTNGQTSRMAAFYNTEASPAFYIWRKNYTPDLISDAIDAGITQLDGLTASKRDSLLWWACSHTGRDQRPVWVAEHAQECCSRWRQAQGDAGRKAVRHRDGFIGFAWLAWL